MRFLRSRFHLAPGHDTKMQPSILLLGLCAIVTSAIKAPSARGEQSPYSDYPSRLTKPECSKHTRDITYLKREITHPINFCTTYLSAYVLFLTDACQADSPVAERARRFRESRPKMLSMLAPASLKKPVGPCPRCSASPLRPRYLLHLATQSTKRASAASSNILSASVASTVPCT